MLLSQQLKSYITRRMIIKPVNCFQDNYAYILLDESSKKAAAVDPVEPDNILKALSEYPDYTLSMILTTHHHHDHAGGNTSFLKKLEPEKIKCYGGSEKVNGVNHIVKDNETIQLGSLSIRAITTPCHTMDHICYYVENNDDDRAVFTGDCLFSSGCGRFFEGSAKEMWEALSKLAALPDNTKVYFGHEYTLSNLKFAESVEPHNKDIQEKKKWAQQVKCTTPSTIGNEKLTNPFIRCDLPEVFKHIVHHPEKAKQVDILGQLRRMKDDF
ncbi:hydroxyacylglutathione hydrolase [Cokeromyces recurvatus]|uniref:hydroxyacylglutathione hydrolase n=1 Tax=Cokeromyces recurvatus TaxID=90255 RepID=UPI00221E977B|nr:hydroxyacylglutathione hydrolase [Cokeromyces recurvatus]KAI7906218.1 hydroxyacylglutathione hydrolase [Cokeromyces recurvatus]